MGICIADESGMLVRTNPAFCAMAQYTDSELTGQHFSIVAPPELQPRLQAFLDAVLEESPRVREEWRLRRRDGALVEVLAGFRTLTMPGG